MYIILTELLGVGTCWAIVDSYDQQQLKDQINSKMSGGAMYHILYYNPKEVHGPYTLLRVSHLVNLVLKVVKALDTWVVCGWVVSVHTASIPLP